MDLTSLTDMTGMNRTAEGLRVIGSLSETELDQNMASSMTLGYTECNQNY